MSNFNLYILCGGIIAFIFLVYKGIKYQPSDMNTKIAYILIALWLMFTYPFLIFLLPIYFGKAIRYVFN